MNDVPLDRHGRPLAGAALAARLRLVAGGRKPPRLEAELELVAVARHRGGQEPPPWRR